MKASTRRRITPLLHLGLLVTVACTADQPPRDEGEVEVQPQLTLDAATTLGVQNARMPGPALITAGQLSQEQFDGLAAAGFENFISLRLADEGGAGWRRRTHPARV